VFLWWLSRYKLVCCGIEVSHYIQKHLTKFFGVGEFGKKKILASAVGEGRAALWTLSEGWVVLDSKEGAWGLESRGGGSWLMGNLEKVGKKFLTLWWWCYNVDSLIEVSLCCSCILRSKVTEIFSLCLLKGQRFIIKNWEFLKKTLP
jgi:hypothetical protein